MPFYFEREKVNDRLTDTVSDLLLALKIVIGEQGHGMKWSERCQIARDAIRKAESVLDQAGKTNV